MTCVGHQNSQMGMANAMGHIDDLLIVDLLLRPQAAGARAFNWSRC